MIFLNGCATGSSELWGDLVCPPVVDYSREERQRMAKEVEALPEDSILVDWLADYAVLRTQLDDCRQMFTFCQQANSPSSLPYRTRPAK
jgi:hypothetical protein